MYNINTLAWSQLPDSGCRGCAAAIVNGLRTLIGGIVDIIDITNKLFSFTRKGKIAKWTEEFPPMRTKRYGACVLAINKALSYCGWRKWMSCY